MKHLIQLALLTVLFSPFTFAKPSENVVTLKQKGDSIEIHLDKKKTQGYMALWVKSEDNKLWKINLKYYDGGTLKLGVVPKEPVGKRGGGTVKVEQILPKENPVFPRNTKLSLFVSYRDDQRGVVGANYSKVTFELDDDGNLKPMPNKTQ